MFKELAKHLFPRMTLSDNLRIRYTFCLGGLAFTCLLVLAGTGPLMRLTHPDAYAAAVATFLDRL